MGDFDNGADDSQKYAELAAEMNAEDAKDGIDRPPIDFDRTELQPLEPDGAGRESTYQNDGGQDDAVARRAYQQHVAAQQQHQQPTYPTHNLPDVLENPIEHFSARMQLLEAMSVGDYTSQQQIQQQAEMTAIRSHLDRADAEGRAEIGEENFNSAMDHLLGSRQQELAEWAPDNSAHAQQLAQQNGYRTAADMRAAVLGAEIAHAAQTAAQHGLPLWAYAVQLARERGHVVPVAATNSQRRQISKAITGAKSDTDFDRAWNIYSQVNKAEDQLAKRPRR